MPLATIRLLHEVTDVQMPAHQQLEMERLTGAMSNVVYMCTSKGMPPILLRLYGDGSDVFFDRETELAVFTFMSEQGLGPRLLGTFAGGRFEEFLDADSLTRDQMREPDTARAIGRALAKVHCVVQVATTLPNLPSQNPSESSLWPRLRDWNTKAQAIAAKWTREGKQLGGIDVSKLFKEVQALTEKLQRFPSHIVFCHNDVR